MPDLLGATNPVPGYDRSVTNRSDVVSPNNINPKIQNAQIWIVSAMQMDEPSSRAMICRGEATSVTIPITKHFSSV